MKTQFLICLLASISLVVGCSVESRRDCLVNTNQLTAVTNVCTRLVPQANAETKVAMVHGIAIGDECNRQWVNYHLDDVVPPPDIINCAIDALVNLYLITNTTAEDMPITAPEDEAITDEMLIAARGLFDAAIERFQAAMQNGL